VKSYNKDILKDYLINGSGLFTSRTVSQWIFNACDPLVSKLLNGAQCVNLRTNATSESQALGMSKPFTVNTGVKDISKILTYELWNGTNQTVFGKKIVGANDDGQFPPFSPEYRLPSLTIFEDDYQKTIKLEPSSSEPNSIFRNISFYRYLVSNDTWKIDNSSFSNNYTGFSWIGAAYENIPIYFGNPYFYGADNIWLTRVKGVVPPPDNNNLEKPLYTLLYVDHYTGKIMFANQCLQVNIHLNTSVIANWFAYDPLDYQNIPSETMWPMVYIKEYAAMSQSQADKYIDSFKQVDPISNGILYGLISLGALLFILGAILTTRGSILLKNTSSYTFID